MKLKDKKPSLIDFTRKYANNIDECYSFFFRSKFPDGFCCEKCGCKKHYKIIRHNVAQCRECAHQHYLYSGTIFQDNKLEPYKLLLGIFLFFTANKGMSAIELRSHLDVNYKTALLLIRKCRILMTESGSKHILDSLFYEADTAYIGAKSKEEKHQGMATEKQPFLVLLSTAEDNRYPLYLKLFPIPKDNSEIMKHFISKSACLTEYRTLNTDGKTTFNSLKDSIRLVSEKIDYDKKDHRLYWLNIITGNIKNHITGIYHGISKRDLPLFLKEQEYRFNHRNCGKTMVNKINGYIARSSPHPRKSIVNALNKAEPYFNPYCV